MEEINEALRKIYKPRDRQLEVIKTRHERKRIEPIHTQISLIREDEDIGSAGVSRSIL